MLVFVQAHYQPETDLDLPLIPSVEIIKPLLPSPLEGAVWECALARRVAHSARAKSAVGVPLRSPDPVKRLVRDAVLSEKEAQLGRMFLHVAHGVQL
jgi:hypothetical protein